MWEQPWVHRSGRTRRDTQQGQPVKAETWIRVTSSQSRIPEAPETIKQWMILLSSSWGSMTFNILVSTSVLSNSKRITFNCLNGYLVFPYCSLRRLTPQEYKLEQEIITFFHTSILKDKSPEYVFLMYVWFLYENL